MHRKFWHWILMDFQDKSQILYLKSYFWEQLSAKTKCTWYQTCHWKTIKHKDLWQTQQISTSFLDFINVRNKSNKQTTFKHIQIRHFVNHSDGWRTYHFLYFVLENAWNWTLKGISNAIGDWWLYGHMSGLAYKGIDIISRA